MRTRRRTTIEDLRLAIDCLPRPTRIAMLEGIRSNEIIVGAYSNRNGICPMLAAHRCGGRTNLISFARAWDRFALGATRKPGARKATLRELQILTTHLEASLLEDELPSAGLAAAIAEHRELVASRRVRPGDPDRGPELRKRPGWSWLRVVRSYNEYERVLELLDRERAATRDREHAATQDTRRVAKREPALV